MYWDNCNVIHALQCASREHYTECHVVHTILYMCMCVCVRACVCVCVERERERETERERERFYTKCNSMQNIKHIEHAYPYARASRKSKCSKCQHTTKPWARIVHFWHFWNTFFSYLMLLKDSIYPHFCLRTSQIWVHILIFMVMPRTEAVCVGIVGFFAL